MESGTSKKPNIKRQKIIITGDTSRVVTRLHLPHEKHRITKIIKRILGLSDPAANKLKAQVMLEFAERHEDIEHIFDQHLKAVQDYLPADIKLNDMQKALIGACFTKEYAIESAALFNPSIVAHPDQSHLKKNCMRFIMSLRATGEGHMSSVVFRSGVLDQHNNIIFDPISEFVKTPDQRLNPAYNSEPFRHKLIEMGVDTEITDYILDRLPESFSFNALKEQMRILREAPRFLESLQLSTFDSMKLLADSNYELTFRADHRISERVIFPTSKNESVGIEDARFVQFFVDQDEYTYYATYTAYNGKTILPKMIETKDFITFKVQSLSGKAVKNKGMALFPRKIKGNYVMLSRQDGENNHIMFSENRYSWQTSQILQEPELPWEFLHVGNCGSPLETREGWIVLTHGVGPVRKYCIGAMLLDLENPAKIIARLDEPLLSPHAREREGYVPNVVYTCGAIIHNHELVIPYAMSDINSGIATVPVKDLLDSMRRLD